MRCSSCKEPIRSTGAGIVHIDPSDFIDCPGVGVVTKIQGCTCTEGSTECDVCRDAACTCHDIGPACNYCIKEHNAGEAQSAERLPRKQEAAGSIPATSSSITYVCDKCDQPITESKSNPTGWTHIWGYSLSCMLPPKPRMESKLVSYGFTREQRQMMGDIVSTRLLFEDTKKKLADIVSEQKKAEDKVKSITLERESLEKSMILAEQSLIFSEKRLRESILQDVMIKGLPEAIEVPETKAEAHIEAENIGREA